MLRAAGRAPSVLCLVATAAAVLIAACGPGDAGRAGGPAGGADTATAAAPREPWTPELAAELREMRRVDQEVREGFGPATVTDTAFMARMLRTDSAHSLRLRTLVERHGWPSASDVGEEAAQGAFLVVQHTPLHEWQRAMLPLIEDAARAGELDAQSFALLYDRVQMNQGRPQRYGTQVRGVEGGTLRLHPLEDPAAVDSLRAELGLPPLSDYLDLLEEHMGMPVDRSGLGG